jgi:GT2 family glycosyltransferase
VRYFLELCLKSVHAAIEAIEAEIIVVDNNSEDDSCSMVKQLFPDVKLIENKDNFGFSKGNNIGVAHAKGEYLCILNPDTVVAEDTFAKLLAFCEGKKGMGAVGCKLINGMGEFLPESKRNIPYVKAAFKKLFGDPSQYYSNLHEDNTGEIDVLVGAFMFLKKDVYNTVGGLDEDYFMYGEDIDLSYKILKAGYKNYYCGDVVAIHYKGESTLRDKHYARRFYGAMQIFYKKHFKRNLLFDMFVSFGIRTVYFFRKVQREKKKSVFQYVLISNTHYENLDKVLPKILVQKNKIDNFEVETEVILDANFLNHKEIISIMHKYSGSKKWTYKILPKNANFILGSDNAISRGEVMRF